MLRFRRIAGLTALSLCLAEPRQAPLTPDIEAALDRISADSLRGHLSFIASDLLEGRDTPSPGLNIAAEYIAAQFRRAGLEPAGDDGYFQTVTMVSRALNFEGFSFRLSGQGEDVTIPAGDVAVQSEIAIEQSGASLYKLALDDEVPSTLEGQAVITEAPDLSQADGPEQFSARNSRIVRAKPSVIIVLQRQASAPSLPASGSLFAPGASRPEGVPLIIAHNSAALALFDRLASGEKAGSVSVHLASPRENEIKLRNVVAVLRGSDSALRDTCELLTAHYDHIGRKPPGDGDRIYNGANDDGSGTVSVIEIAAALATLKERPKRSIVFVAFFGEEKGGFGSSYFARHPLCPLDKTIAQVNLEQLGRTDTNEGTQIGRAAFTGFDYSDMPKVFQKAGEATGVEVFRNGDQDEAYFSRSDNIPFARRGVPAHTLAVAFEFPDYHRVEDEWTKIDYANMAKIDRMIALGLILMANSSEAPKWNESNPRAARYAQQRKQRK